MKQHGLYCCGMRKVFSLPERESGPSTPSRAAIDKQQSPPLVSDSSVLMQMRTPNAPSLIGPKIYCPDCLEWRHPDGLMKMLTKAIAVQL